MKRGYWIAIILIIVLFGILFFSDKIFEMGSIGSINDSIVEDIEKNDGQCSISCKTDSDCGISKCTGGCMNVGEFEKAGCNNCRNPPIQGLVGCSCDNNICLNKFTIWSRPLK